MSASSARPAPARRTAIALGHHLLIVEEVGYLPLERQATDLRVAFLPPL